MIICNPMHLGIFKNPFQFAEEHFLGEEATVGKTGVRKANWEAEALASKRLVRL